MSPAEYEAILKDALPSEVKIAACEHHPAKGLFDITLRWAPLPSSQGGSRTRFTLTDEATEPMIRVAVAQIVDGLRPSESPRRKVGGR